MQITFCLLTVGLLAIQALGVLADDTSWPVLEVDPTQAYAELKQMEGLEEWHQDDEHSSHQRRHLAEARINKQLKKVFVKSEFDGLRSLTQRAVAKNRKYLLATSGKLDNVLHIVNIENLMDPRIVASLLVTRSEEDEMMAVAFSDDQTLLATTCENYTTTTRVDLENETLEALGQADHFLDQSSFSPTISKDGKMLYHKISDSLNIARANLTDPYNPVYIDPIVIPNPLNHAIYYYAMTSDNYLFFSAKYDGLYCIDISDPSNPVVASVTKAGYRNRFITLSEDENTLFLSDSLEGFFIVDVTNRLAPKVLSGIVIDRRFPDVQLRPMALSDDQNTIYLNTYDGIMLVVNIFDRSSPKIESILPVGYSYMMTVIEDFKWIIQLRGSYYQLFDLSKVYLTERQLLPEFIKVNKPILFEEVEFSEAKNLQKFYHYSDTLDIIAYVDQPIRGSPTFQFYSTALSKTAPKYLGSYVHKHNETDKAKIWMEFNGDGSRLYTATFLVFSETLTFTIVDTSSFASPRIIDEIAFDYIEGRSTAQGNDFIGTTTNLVVDDDQEYVFFGLQQDSLLAISVADDKAEVMNQHKIETQDMYYNSLLLRKEGAGTLLYVLSDNSFQVYDVSVPSQFQLLNRLELEESGGNMTLSEDGNTLFISGGERGLYQINLTNPVLPEILNLFSADDIEIEAFMQRDDQLVTIAGSEVTLFNVSDPNDWMQQGATRYKQIKQVDRIKQTLSFYGQFFDGEDTIEIGSSYIPSILYIDTNQEENMELGDNFKTLTMFPMELKVEATASGQQIYKDIWDDYKFIAFRQFVKYENGHVTDPFPKWITADPANSRMLLELNTPEALGTQFIYAQLSFKIPDDAFIGLAGIKTLVDSIRLKDSLMEKGYIDQESFNSDFDLNKRLKVPYEFSPNEGIVEKRVIVDTSDENLYNIMVNLGTLTVINETHSLVNQFYNKDTLYTQVIFLKHTAEDYSKIVLYLQHIIDNMLEPKIKAILKSYYLELVGEFTVHESLRVSITDKINLSTLSKNLITVSVSIDGNGQCAQIADNKLGLITEQKSKIVIDGNIYDVQDALSKIKINQPDLSLKCPGRITVDDQLNPLRTLEFTDVQQFTSMNQPPSFPTHLSQQFMLQHAKSNLYYDTFFEFQPKVKTEENEQITYHVMMAPKSDGELEFKPIDLEDWIQYDSDTGLLSGNPTAEKVFSTYIVRYNVSDEFTSIYGQVEIYISPTLTYIIEMAIQFGSFAAVAFGCWKYRDEIHTALCVKQYRYHKDEKAFLGQSFLLEIPIIRLELEEENPIIQHMKNRAGRRKKRRKEKKEQVLVVNNPLVWIVEYFDFDGNFKAEEFVQDLKMLDLDSYAEEVQEEALKQFGFMVCYSIYKNGPIDIEDRVISLFGVEVKNDAVWEALKIIMFDIVRSINSKSMHLPLITYSENVKQVFGFKVKTEPAGFVGQMQFAVEKKLKMHLTPLPMPTCMPVWLKCEMDANYIILQGVPRPENKNEITYIRIFDQNDFIIREFLIEVIEIEEVSLSFMENEGSEVQQQQDPSPIQSFSRNFTSAFRNQWRRDTRFSGFTSGQLISGGKANEEDSFRTNGSSSEHRINSATPSKI